MKALALVACAGMAASLTGVARGQPISWAAPVNGSWGTAGNWSPTNVPDNSGEDALLGFAGAYFVSISAAGYGIGALNISNPLAELHLDASDSIGTTTLAISANSTNNGLIRLTTQTSSNNARFQINANAITLGGTGELRMEEVGDDDFYINVGGGGSFTNAAGHRITGAGTILGAGCTLTNNGTILGDRAGGMLVSNHINNAGTMRTTGAGSMTLTSGVTVTQSGTGFIEADGATLTMNGSTVSSNTVRSKNGGVISVGPSGATISGITAEGSWDIPASDVVGTTVLVMNTGITNNALIRLSAQPTSNNARFQINANAQTLGGTGEVRMEEVNDDDFYINVGGGGSFTNGPSHKITGAGVIQGAGCTLTNQGTILGNRTGGMILANHIDNQGTVRAVSPGSMTLQSGMVMNQSGAGVVEADNATVTLNNATINNNTVRSVNGGVISVGPSGGAISGITAEGSWDIPASDVVGTTVLVMGNSITNNALIRLSAQTTTNNARFQINANAQTLGGTGEVRMEEAADDDFYINYGGGGSFTNGVSHKITGTGLITGAGCTLTNKGTILGDRAGGMSIVNHIDNQGTMRAVAPGSITIAGGTVVTQSGSGVVEADGATVMLNNATINSNTVRAKNGGVILIGPSGGTISGITAEGNWDIAASAVVGTTTLVMGNSVTNNGLIRLSAQPTTNNARFQINANAQTLGGTGEVRMEEAGQDDFYINVGGGGSFTNGQGHKISGVGTITGAGCALTNAGILAPGVPLGTLRLINNTTLTSTSVVEIEVGGDAAGQRDFLDGTGSSIALNGTLKVVFRDGYILPACSSFVVVKGNLSGVFATEDLPVMPEGKISVSYGTQTVTIGYIPGDLNGDALLDFSDYLEFLNLYDDQDPRADLTQDGLVDFSDYLEFLNLYNTPCS